MQISCLTNFNKIDPRANELTNSSIKSTLSLITSRENKKANTLCKKALVYEYFPDCYQSGSMSSPITLVSLNPGCFSSFYISQPVENEKRKYAKL